MIHGFKKKRMIKYLQNNEVMSDRIIYKMFAEMKYLQRHMRIWVRSFTETYNIILR